MTPVANLPPVVNLPRVSIPAAICHRYQRHRRQVLPPVPLVLLTPVANLPPVSTIPAANLPPVSTTPVANCHRSQQHQRQICHRCRWHRWQIMRTISGCRHLKLNLKAKFTYMLTLLPKGAQTRLLKFVCLKIFSIWCCTLSREYLCEFSKKFEMSVMVFSDAWGKLIHEKNQKLKISWHCPFNINLLRFASISKFFNIHVNMFALLRK